MSKEEYVMVKKTVFRVIYELSLKKDLSVEPYSKDRISTLNTLRKGDADLRF